jgi:hypothetical protein
MASIKDLKKDINYVLGDIIEAVYLWEAATNNLDSKEGSALIDQAIEVFDGLIARVNDKKADNRSAHLKSVKNDLEAKATELVTSLNKLSA